MRDLVESISAFSSQLINFIAWRLRPVAVAGRDSALGSEWERATGGPGRRVPRAAGWRAARWTRGARAFESASAPPPVVYTRPTARLRSLSLAIASDAIASLARVSGIFVVKFLAISLAFFFGTILVKIHRCSRWLFQMWGLFFQMIVAFRSVVSY